MLKKGGNKKPAHYSQKQFKSLIFNPKEKFRAGSSIEFENVKPEDTLCSFQDGKDFFC